MKLNWIIIIRTSFSTSNFFVFFLIFPIVVFWGFKNNNNNNNIAYNGYMSNSPNSLTLEFDYMRKKFSPVAIFFVFLLCQIIVKCCSLVCHEKYGCVFSVRHFLVCIAEKRHNHPLLIYQYVFTIFFVIGSSQSSTVCWTNQQPKLYQIKQQKGLLNHKH